MNYSSNVTFVEGLDMQASATQNPISTDPSCRLPAGMERPLADLRDLLEALAADDLLGLTVFGPVLEPEFEKSDHGATTVLVLRKIDLMMIRRLATHGPQMARMRVAAPLTMTPEYIASSSDSFPLELLEIHQRRLTLCGRDYFEQINIEPEYLRLQCEREFKRILIRLRQGLLATGGKVDFLVDLERDIALQTLRTLRGVLWLDDRKEYLPATDVLAACESIAGRKLAGLREAVRPDAEGSWDEFEAVYQDVELLATKMDGQTSNRK
ncbi:MAG: hypothetical protein IT419_04560 [Planctomycetes bacterium]|jgi:hypothetical protein|nr:hypothetical protein [Planctomycetota bacterium]